GIRVKLVTGVQTCALPISQIIVVALVEGSMGIFFRVSESAALPQVVPKEQLADAIAQNQAREQGAGVISQPLAGFLFALGRMVQIGRASCRERGEVRVGAV